MSVLLKLTVLFFLLFLGISCDREDEIATVQMGEVVFSLGNNPVDENGRSQEGNPPSAVILSVADKHGNVVFENKRLNLLPFGQGFVTEGLSMHVGNFQLTRFFVTNTSDEIIYASPLTGSKKAAELERPLPLDFAVGHTTPTQLVPQVLPVAEADTPGSFGYINFGFEVVDDPGTMNVKVKVELRVGEIDYLNVDTRVVIKGFDIDSQEKWSQDFSYTGPTDNVFSVKSGFDHYTLEINHWGINDKQIIKGVHLYEGRGEGPSPVTYVMGGAVAARKLSHYISYIEMKDSLNPGSTYMAPQQKVVYRYNLLGKVEKMSVYGYSPKTKTFTEDRYFLFTYANNRVARLAGYHAENDQHYIEDVYYYMNNGNVSKIIEKNDGSGITSEVNFSYSFTDRVVKAAYSFSNGQSFNYEIFYDHKNIESDKTTRWGGLCSQGSYDYDKSINPLKHLGYVDFLLRNYSINNRVEEDIQYLACSFPTLIPERYRYVYDAEGYPTIATTYYGSNSGVWEAKTHYFYQ